MYPKSALAIAEKLLREEDRSLQRFVRCLIEARLAQALALAAAEVSIFANLNSPVDLG